MRNLHILSPQYKYNQHIAMISRNMRHPDIPPMLPCHLSSIYRISLVNPSPILASDWSILNVILRQKVTTTHNQPRFSSLSKKCSQGPTFYDKEINIFRHPPLPKSLNILQRQVDHFMLGRKLADKILGQICKNIMS